MGGNTYFTVGYEELWSAIEGVMVSPTGIEPVTSP